MWEDANPSNRTLTIRKSKTEAGERMIPLTQEAFSVLSKLFKRAQTFGPVEPQHYVFAGFRISARFNGNEIVETRITRFDPTRPISSWAHGIAQPDKESRASWTEISRPQTPYHNRACRIRSERSDHNGYRRSRLAPCA